MTTATTIARPKTQQEFEARWKAFDDKFAAAMVAGVDEEIRVFPELLAEGKVLLGCVKVGNKAYKSMKFTLDTIEAAIA